MERSWDYGDGKKNAAKVTTGVVIGGSVAAIGAATHGVGIPIIAALAVGGLTVGKMSDLAFAKAWGRQYTGGEATREWLEHTPEFNSFHQSKLLEERADKTVRRAFQHYRTACDKVGQLRNLRAARTCEQALDMVTAMLHLKRHLDKARIYIHPAIFLLQHVLEYYEKAWQIWSGKDKEVVNDSWHWDSHCGSHTCYLNVFVNAGRPIAANSWDDLGVDKEKRLLLQARNEIGRDPVFEGLYAGKPHPATTRLYRLANLKYARRDLTVKISHGVTNDWERKTLSERAGFVFHHAASVALAAGAAGAHVRADEILNGLAVFIDQAFNSTDLGISGAADQVRSNPANGDADIRSQRAGAQMAEDAQDGIYKAAVHLWEISEVMTVIRSHNRGQDSYKGTTCDEAIEYLRQVYKIRHHLEKTQRYLKEAIELVAKLTSKINQSIAAVNKINNGYCKSIDSLMDYGSHPQCAKGSCLL